MTTNLDDFEALLADVETAGYDEAVPPPLRMPSGRRSFQSRFAPGPASQSQVRETTRSLDDKIDTLRAAVTTLESRTNGIATTQQKAAVALHRESIDRRKTLDGVRADLQQTKMFSFLLPILFQKTTTITDAAGTDLDVLVPQDDQLTLLLPLLLMTNSYSSGGDTAKSGFDPMMMVVLLLALTNKDNSSSSKPIRSISDLASRNRSGKTSSAPAVIAP
jgi:hypothetical protein